MMKRQLSAIWMKDANEVSYAMSLCREKNPKGIFFLGGDLEYFEKDFKYIPVPCVLLTNSGKDLKFTIYPL